MGNAMIFGGARMTVPSVGIPLSDFPETQIVMIPENGVPTQFWLAKHNYEENLNGTGRTLLVRRYAHSDQQWHTSNVNAYATSYIDSWLNGTYKALLYPEVQEAIGSTTFYYTPGNGTTTVSTLSRGIFLLSTVEVSNNEGTICNIEGSKLASPLGDVSNNPLVSENSGFWSRSPAIKSETNLKTKAAYMLWANYASMSSATCSTAKPILPAFTLPSTMLVDPEPNADGSVNLMY